MNFIKIDDKISAPIRKKPNEQPQKGLLRRLNPFKIFTGKGKGGEKTRRVKQGKRKVIVRKYNKKLTKKRGSKKRNLKLKNNSIR